jgi:hypothetical protein
MRSLGDRGATLWGSDRLGFVADSIDRTCCEVSSKTRTYPRAFERARPLEICLPHLTAGQSAAL